MLTRAAYDGAGLPGAGTRIKAASAATIKDVKITKEMLDLAKHIVEQKSGHFEPDKFQDHYEAALQDLQDKKQKGLPITKAARPTGGNVVDLMGALRASLKGDKTASAKKTKAKPATKRKAG